MAQSRVLTFTIPCGKGGLNRMENYLDFPPEDLAWVDGLTAEHNAWEKEGGASKFYSSALSDPITCVHDAWNSAPSGSPTVPEATTQKLIVFKQLSTNTINTYNTSGTLLNSQNLVLTTTSRPWVVDGIIRDVIRSQLAFSDNGLPYYSVPESYNWVTFSQLPTDWAGSVMPHFGFAHNFRVLAMTKFSSILYMSSPTDHSKFGPGVPNTRIMDVYPGEEHYMAAGCSWRGRAYLFKWARGVYYVDDSDSNIANWRTIKVTDAIGAAGPGCVVAYEDDVIILGSDAYFYSLSDVQTLGQRSVKPILPTELGEFFRTEINTGRLDLVRSVYYPRKRQIWFALPAAGSTVNNRRLVFDANLPGKIRVMWSERDEMTCLATRRNANVQEPMWGDASGFVWVGDKAARNKDGSAYLGQFETPPFSIFPQEDRFANLKELNVTFKPKGAYDLSLEVHTDNVLSQTLTLSQQSTGSPTGSFSLDAEFTAGTIIGTKVVPLEGEARRVKFVGRNNADDENFAVQALAIRHTPGRHGTV